MALAFFEDNSSSGSGELLFLDEWLKENPKPKNLQHDVTEIVAVKSGKGYLLKTDSFQVFIWKKAKITTMLVEALERWCVTAPNEGHPIIVAIDLKHKDKYRLAADKDKSISWFQSGNGYTTTEYNADCPDPNGNPFL